MNGRKQLVADLADHDVLVFFLLHSEDDNERADKAKHLRYDLKRR